jgi:DnaJ like chaperone protein
MAKQKALAGPAVLSLGETFLEYDGRRYSYDEIGGIQYSPMGKMPYFGQRPIHDVRLRLFLRSGRVLNINQDSTGGDGRTVDELAKANHIISAMTFDRRMAIYEEKLERTGFVEFGGYQIYKDGNIFKRGIFLFNLESPNVEFTLTRFHLVAEQKRGFLDRLTKEKIRDAIPIDTDRDCFLYIMKNRFALAWGNEQVLEKSPRYVLFEALLHLGAKVCKADGRVTKDEIQRFRSHFGITEKELPNAAEIFQSAIKSSTPVGATARRIKNLASTTPSLLDHILIGLIAVAASDGEITSSERDVILEVGRAFDEPPSDIQQMFAMFEESSGREQKSSDKLKRPTGQSSAASIQLQVLGLVPGANFDQVRVAYKDLVRRYHPDLLKSQKLPLESMKLAEDMLKAINSAYAWLEKNYAPSG